MLFSTSPSQSDASSPFVLWLRQEDQTLDGHFRPAAAVEFTPALRTSGLLREVPGEELKTLLLVLTFVTPNGLFQPTLPALADGLRLSPGKMQGRLERLRGFSWQGEPLLHRVERESGMHAYAPSLQIVSTHHAPVPATAESQTPAYRAAGREAVIAHSRAMYTRPRAEVEREIALLNGWPLPETGDAIVPPEAAPASSPLEPTYLKQRLLRLGVSNEQADYLLSQHTPEEIAQQIEWLPYRNAKNPAGFLVAAIEAGYDEPLLLRRQRALESAPEPTTGCLATAPETAAQSRNAQTVSETHTPPALIPAETVFLELPTSPADADHFDEEAGQTAPS